MAKHYRKLRVIIADDHELVREGLQLMIKKIDSIEVVGEAKNGEELIALTRKLDPDVLLVDIQMPKCDGITATKIIKQEFPHIGVVGISSFDEEHLVLDLVAAGGKGYILKNTKAREIEAAVYAVFGDESYYATDVTVKLAQMLARNGLYNNAKLSPIGFNERDLTIIKLICEGCSSKEIADTMGYETRSVERYRDKIMAKMKVRNAAGLVSHAIRHGIYKIASNRHGRSKS